MKNFKQLITSIGFELELSDKETRINSQNPHAVKLFIELISEEYAEELANNSEAKAELDKLQVALDVFNAREAIISKEALKEVYTLLKERKIHPVGIFDKRGRFYLEDDELVDARSPSAAYPYSQMNAGRTSKFVKAMAEKYKVQSKEELLALFTSKN